MSTTWNQWYRPETFSSEGWVAPHDPWQGFLPTLGFKGYIGNYVTGSPHEEASVPFEYSPEAKEEINRLKNAGVEILTRSDSGPNPTWAIKTPQDVWQYNSKSRSDLSTVLSELAPFAGLLLAPLTGGISSALASVVGPAAAPIVSQALVSGTLSEASGGDFLSGALKGGLTGGISSLVSPIASSIGTDVLSSTGSQGLADAAKGAIKAGAASLPAGLISGDMSNVLSSALKGGAMSGFTGATMPGAGTTESVEDIEDFFGFGKPGFMPTEYLDDAEVQRELTSLLGRAPAPQAPSDWFLGENIMSGIPEWDMAAVNAGLPIGNLEQDFSVAQTKEGPRIVDSAGNVGTFVNGEFVVDTGVTPDLSYAAAPAPAPASKTTAKPPPPPPPPAPGQKARNQDDLGLLMALAGMMTPQQQAQDDYQLAQIGAQSPYGIYGA